MIINKLTKHIENSETTSVTYDDDNIKPYNNKCGVVCVAAAIAMNKTNEWKR